MANFVQYTEHKTMIRIAMYDAVPQTVVYARYEAVTQTMVEARYEAVSQTLVDELPLSVPQAMPSEAGPSHYPSRYNNRGSSRHGIMRPCLNICYDQLKSLTRERIKVEADLALNFPGTIVSSVNSMPVPRLPLNPSGVDRLVIEMIRERTRLITIVALMENLRGSEMPGVLLNIQAWQDSIKKVEKCRREEIAGRMSADKTPLITSLQELMKTTSRARLSLSVAYHLTVPDNSEDTASNLSLNSLNI